MSRSTASSAMEAERAMRQVQSRLEGNGYCADCGKNGAEYVNITLGTFICTTCADIHRSISNRRIKDMYGRDLTMDDVRRMDSVGNDVANRKFLANWNPHDYPEPKPEDKEAVQEFIWLKYEGSWKKQAPPPQQSNARGGYDRQYGDERGRNAYGRERDLFRNDPPPPPLPRRSVWAERLGRNAPRPEEDHYMRSRAAPPNPLHQDHIEYMRRGPPPMHDDRYRTASHQQRFRPPHAPQTYEAGAPMRQRYDDYYEDEYMLHQREELGLQRSSRDNYPTGVRKAERSRSKQTYRNDTEEDNESDEFEEDRGHVRKRSTRLEKKLSRSQSTRRRKAVQNEDYDDDEEEESDDYENEREARKKSSSRKAKSLKSKKKNVSSSRRREHVESEDESEEVDGSESDDLEEEQSTKRKGRKKKDQEADSKGSSKRRTSNTRAHNAWEEDTGPTQGVCSSEPLGVKAEFDLMSDWMGGDTDAATVQSSSSAQTAGTGPQQAPGPQHQPTPPAVPMMAPMSVYGGMIPPGGAAYMTGFPMMAPHGLVQVPAMSGMPQMAGVPAMAMPGMQGMPMASPMGAVHSAGVPGLVQGMQNLGMQGAGAQQVPPPPPPGTPAGPPPGPPPS